MLRKRRSPRETTTLPGLLPHEHGPGAGLTQATEILPPRRTPTRGGAPLWIATIVKHVTHWPTRGSNEIVVVAATKFLPFLLAKLTTRGNLGENLEVRLTRRAGGEKNEHRRRSGRVVAKAVHTALGHVQKVAGRGVDPALAVE